MAKYTPEYFREQLCLFRELMGQRDWMLRDDWERFCAVMGIGICFLNTKCPDSETQNLIVDQFWATITEYYKRLDMIALHPPESLPENDAEIVG